MQWSDIDHSRRPRKLLRQFAVLCLVVFGGLALWRAWRRQSDAWTLGLAARRVVVGVLGLDRPRRSVGSSPAG